MPLIFNNIHHKLLLLKYLNFVEDIFIFNY